MVRTALCILLLGSLTAAGADEIVFDFCLENRLPLAVAMAGGYAPDVEDIVDIHFETVRQALHHHRATQVTS